MDNKNNWGYKAGYLLGASILVCIAALIIAVTARLIVWMF